jgi:signal transduction histidine kinase
VLAQANLGRQIVTFKVWNHQGRILYSSNTDLIGRVFPIDEGLAAAWQGNVSANISNLQGAENVDERQKYSRLLQIYCPVRLYGTDQIIAVAELYQKVDSLQSDINTAQWHTWLAVGLAMLLIYFALIGFVRGASRTIERQGVKLTQQVQRLTELLIQNGELHDRVQRASANAAASNERFLRRISAELHDGPVQELGAALLRMDRVIGQNPGQPQLPAIQSSLQTAIQEVRGLAGGLGLPQLDGLRLEEVLAQVVNSHERRTGSKVKLTTAGLPEQVDLPVKITLYRIVQEALNNAFRHAGGVGQAVNAKCAAGRIQVEVSDQGPGFDVNQSIDWEQHLGLAGMRERVESLGGLFSVESQLNHGSRVTVSLPLQPAREQANE